jgi:hypothetical protein
MATTKNKNSETQTAATSLPRSNPLHHQKRSREPHLNRKTTTSSQKIKNKK